MKKACHWIIAAVACCTMLLLSAFVFVQPKAEAASMASAGTVPHSLIKSFESKLSAVSDHPGVSKLSKKSTLSAQNSIRYIQEDYQDIQAYYDSDGDVSLALDFSSLEIAYDKDDSTYNFLIEFADPFVGIGDNEYVDICLDVDKNPRTGDYWPSINLGSDYSIFIESDGSDGDWIATLVKTPSEDDNTWSTVGEVGYTELSDGHSILIWVPVSYLGSPLSFNFFMYSFYEGTNNYYSDDLPDDGYATYSRSGSTYQDGQFSDVTSQHRYFRQINDLADRKIISGFPNGTFQPNSSVTRQQFAKMIVKTMGYPVSQANACPFTDVPSGLDANDPLYPDKYVAVCAARGVTVGKTPTKFDPFGNITRAQLITMVTRAAGIADPPRDYTPPFSRYDNTHYPFSRTAAYAGLLNGLEGIGPNYNFFKSATRGEVCLVLYNLLHR
ncbi:MAG: S-layer homology domain-containing protein [Thermoleophilia bacterium]